MIEELSAVELDELSRARNEQEWNSSCDRVKKARGGMYPPDWYRMVIASGLAARVQLSWGSK